MSGINTFNPKQPVFISDRAKAHFIHKLKQSNCARGVRVGIKTSGCSGYQYVIDYIDEPPSEQSQLIELNPEFYLQVDPEAIPIIKGTTIDLVQEGLNESIEFQNPNVQSRCGCGESFSIDS